jgi:hypothetical protein
MDIKTDGCSTAVNCSTVHLLKFEYADAGYFIRLHVASFGASAALGFPVRPILGLTKMDL